MQTNIASDDRISRICAGLNEETAALEALNRGFSHRVAAWRLAHETTIGHATSLLTRIDALIAKFDAR